MLLQCSEMVYDDYKERFDVKNIEAMGSLTVDGDGGAVYKLLSQIAGNVKELTDSKSKRNMELELARQKAVSVYQARKN